MTARPGRYVRRLLVVTAAIAFVVALGYAWRASPLASLVTDSRHGPAEGHGPAGRQTPPGNARFDGRGGGRDSGGVAGRVADLVQTGIVGSGVLAAVVVVDKTRRRRHPIAPRPNRSSADPPFSPG